METITICERDSYAGLISLGKPGPMQQVNVLVKISYQIKDDELVLTKPESLQNNIYDETCTPRLNAGSDFYPYKSKTDVIVEGAAFCETPKPRHDVLFRIGRHEKKIAVFGEREIMSSNGYIRISDPEPFSMMPLTYQNAYGGIDMRVPFPSDDERAAMLEGVDHPGLYPRNPFGKGYLVVDGPIPEGTEMPNLEDPDDLLTTERLLTGDPRLWYRQPLPACCDWLHPMCFPRYVHMGSDAWFEGPENEDMPEVARGHLPVGYRSLMSKTMGPNADFFQGASCGLTFDLLNPGESVQLYGVHPESPWLAFRVPEAPEIVIDLEGDRKQVPVQLHHMVCRPDDEVVHFVYGAHRSPNRMFIPGVHTEIPVSVSVNRDIPIRYKAPTTMRQRLKDAGL